MRTVRKRPSLRAYLESAKAVQNPVFDLRLAKAHAAAKKAVRHA